jgi:hypothetical protein
VVEVLGQSPTLELEVQAILTRRMEGGDILCHLGNVDHQSGGRRLLPCCFYLQGNSKICNQTCHISQLALQWMHSDPKRFTRSTSHFGLQFMNYSTILETRNFCDQLTTVICMH